MFAVCVIRTPARTLINDVDDGHKCSAMLVSCDIGKHDAAKRQETGYMLQPDAKRAVSAATSIAHPIRPPILPVPESRFFLETTSGVCVGWTSFTWFGSALKRSSASGKCSTLRPVDAARLGCVRGESSQARAGIHRIRKRQLGLELRGIDPVSNEAALAERTAGVVAK